MLRRRKSESCTLEGLQNFGQWLWLHRVNKDIWSCHLKEWFKENCPNSSKLTQLDLCIYLADVTGYEEMGGYLYRYKMIERMRNIRSLNETRVLDINFSFSVALAKAEFLSLKEHRIDLSKIDIFKDVLDGRLNPLSGKPIIKIHQ